MWKSKKTEMKKASINKKNAKEQRDEYIKFNDALQALIKKCEGEIEYYMEVFEGEEEDRKEYLENLEFYILLKELKNTSVYENIQYKCKRKLQRPKKKITKKDFEPVVRDGKSYKSKYVMCRCNSPVLRHNWKRHIKTPVHMKKLENIAMGKKCIDIDENILSYEETMELIDKSLYNTDYVEIHNDDCCVEREEEPPLQIEPPQEKKEKKKKKKTKKKRKLILSKEDTDFRNETRKIIENRNKSAIVIQKHIRGRITRKRVEKMKKDKKETLYENKVILMQSLIRRYISKQKVIKMKKINKIKNKKEKQKEKITCECGSTYTARMKARHLKSMKHCKFIENQ